MVQSLLDAGGIEEEELESIIKAIMKREELGSIQTPFGFGTSAPVRPDGFVFCYGPVDPQTLRFDIWVMLLSSAILIRSSRGSRMPWLCRGNFTKRVGTPRSCRASK